MTIVSQRMVVPVPPQRNSVPKPYRKLLGCEMSSDNELSGSATWAWNAPDPSSIRAAQTQRGPPLCNRHCWRDHAPQSRVGLQVRAHWDPQTRGWISRPGGHAQPPVLLLSWSFAEQQHSLSNGWRDWGGGNFIEVCRCSGGAALKGCLCQMTGFKWHQRECHDWGFASKLWMPLASCAANLRG